MSDRFRRAFGVTHGVEGGNVDDPNDNGGRTGQGVTQARYDLHRRGLGLPPRDVFLIEPQEVEAIYRTYWDMAGCEQQPDGAAFLSFDTAIHSGPARSVRLMQEAAGMPIRERDGVCGPATIAAVRAVPIHSLIDRMCDLRLAYMATLDDWRHYKNGWRNRMVEVRARAHEFARGGSPAPMTSPTPIAAARGAVSPAAVAKSLGSNVPAITAAGSVITGGAALATGDGPVQWAIAAVLVLGAACAALVLMRRHMSRAAA